MDIFDLAQKIIGSIGFPVFVAIWFMVKSSQDAAKMTQALNELRDAILILNSKFDNKQVK
ncbi:MAG: hypothetical protein QXF82_00800 [Nitrososphaeria archaeon]